MKRLLAFVLLFCLCFTACKSNDGTESSMVSSSDALDSTTSSTEPTSTATSSAVAGNESTTISSEQASGTKTTTTTKKTTATTSASAQKYDRIVTVNFTDYDTGDDSLSLNSAIEAINMMGSVASVKGEKIRYILKMPKRRYEFNSTIKFNAVQDLTIDGQGSQFIATENINLFNMIQCKNIRLTNFTIDYDPLRYTQGVIKAINGDKVTVEIDEGYESDIKFINGESQTYDPYGERAGAVLSAMIYDVKTGAIKVNSVSAYLFKMDAVSKGGRLVELNGYGNATWETSATWKLEVGDGIALTYTGEKILWADGCYGGMEFVNLTIWGSSGAGFWELNSEGGSLYKNVTVEPGPKPKGATRDRFVTISGDFVHTNCCKKGPTIEDCTFTHMTDDVVNVSGLVYYVVSSNGNKTVIAPRWNYPFYEGEKIRAYDKKTMATKSGTVTVKACKVYNDASLKGTIDQFSYYGDRQWQDKTLVYEVTTDKPMNLKTGDIVVSKDRQGSGTTIRNCTFGKNTARGLVVKCSDVLIENNTIMYSGLPGIALQLDLGFGESDYSSNVIIRKNKLIGCATAFDLTRPAGVGGNLGAISVSYLYNEAYSGYLNNYEHKNILIENNVIDGSAVYGIFCTHADGVTIRNNTIKNPFMYGVNNEIGSKYGFVPNAGILIGQCRNVNVTGNTVTGGPKQITQAVQIDDNVSAVIANSNNQKK